MPYDLFLALTGAQWPNCWLLKLVASGHELELELGTLEAWCLKQASVIL